MLSYLRVDIEPENKCMIKFLYPKLIILGWLLKHKLYVRRQ